MAGGAADQHLHGFRIVGLFQEPEGAQLRHCFDGGFHASERRQDDGRRHIAGIAQAFEQAEPVQPGHVQIGQDHVRGEIVKF